MFNHIPVLLNETIESLNIKPDGIYLDATLGGAGHSIEILKKLSTGKLIGLDQDQNAINASKDRLKDYKNFIPVKTNYVNAKSVLEALNIKKVNGILMDIGVSSHQIDEADRGFSYISDGPLDMRMDKEKDFSAYDVINSYTESELVNIFYKYSEEKWSQRIAKFIIEERTQKPITTTHQLVEVIEKAVPLKARKKGSHPAKRIFQAVRIEVNHELDVLKKAIPMMVDLLEPKGRLSIITFHSLEDRIVKTTFNELARGCICPKSFPVCVCGHIAKIDIITRKPITAEASELDNNSRARSAKLRVAERRE